MARPKTVDEWRIYRELKEKYKMEGVVGLAPIEELFRDQTNEQSWKELAQDMERIFHY